MNSKIDMKTYYKILLQAGTFVPILSSVALAQTTNPAPEPQYKKVKNSSPESESANIRANIHSDIERSWKKWTGAVTNLPAVYRKRNLAGLLTTETNDDAQLVTVVPAPTDPNKNIWKIACLDDVDGSRTVNTVATKTTVVVTSSNPEEASFWSGIAHFYSDDLGFTAPSYEWKLNNTTAESTSSYLDTVDNDTDFSSTTHRLRLADDKLPAGRSTTFKLKVTETSPSRPPTERNATYTVNWHRPLENYIDANDPEYPKTTYKLWGTDVSICSATAGSNINTDGTPATVFFNTTLLGRYQAWGNDLIDRLANFSDAIAYTQLIRDALIDSGIGNDSDNGERSSSTSANIEQMYNKAKQIDSNDPSKLMTDPNYDYDSSVLVKPLYYVEYKLRHISGEAYGKNGYSGQDDYIFASSSDSAGVGYGEGWTGRYQANTGPHS